MSVDKASWSCYTCPDFAPCSLLYPDDKCMIEERKKKEKQVFICKEKRCRHHLIGEDIKYCPNQTCDLYHVIVWPEKMKGERV